MKTLLFGILLFSISVSSQTHRFIYDLVYRPDSTSAEVRKTNYYLDINPEETFYYERSYFVSDSIEHASGIRTFIGKPSDFLSKNLKNKQYVLYSFQNFDIYKLKDTPAMIWNIEREQNVFIIKTSESDCQIRRQELDGLVLKRLSVSGRTIQISWAARNDRGNLRR